ncbi:MAG: hypothetical protein E6K32_11595 [Gammaproteobacteria bacterium]|nr:MAG: hypothetical protein E6K32_11595 [Gammaproteobacteria bacterium]
MRKTQSKADLVGYRNQFDRVRRMLERIYASTDDEHAFTDDLLSFCMHCTHLANWVECDRYVPSRSKHIVAQALTTAKWLPICRDIANGAKQLRLDKPKSGKAAKSSVKRAKRADQERFTLDAFLDDGQGHPIPGRTIALNCVNEWRAILRDAGLTTRRPS